MVVHALLLTLIAASCRQEEIVGGVTDSVFVGTMVELQRINRDPLRDSVGRASGRDSVLQGRGLTPEALERAARELARDPDRAAALMQKIAEAAMTPAPPVENDSTPMTKRAPSRGARSSAAGVISRRAFD
jgi:hypothetical protein